MATLRELAGLYEALPEVQAYDDVVTSPPTKKKRAKTARAANNEVEAKGIRMGVRKLKAISLFLEHATGEMFEAIAEASAAPQLDSMCAKRCIVGKPVDLPRTHDRR